MTSLHPSSIVPFVENSAALLNAMANPGRLKILQILVETEVSVGRLSDLVCLSQSALSQHLAKLREAKLVSARRDAQTIYYRCQSEAVAKILSTLAEFYGPEITAPMRQADKEMGPPEGECRMPSGLRTRLNARPVTT